MRKPEYAPVFLVFVFIVSGCTGIPDGISPVIGFDVNRYTGTWYEIARLDHDFERDMSHVTAEYILHEDNGLRVINQGYNFKEKHWERAVGKAYFIGDSTVGRLKVSFFGPFYGAYNIIALDNDDYNYSMVTGPRRSYLWILARHPDLDQEIMKKLIDKAGEMGFNTEQLIMVDHKTPISKLD